MENIPEGISDDMMFMLDGAASVVFDKNKQYLSVIDRYYTRHYKRITPKVIQKELFDDARVEEDDETCLDQFYFEHSNHLVLFGLS